MRHIVADDTRYTLSVGRLMTAMSELMPSGTSAPSGTTRNLSPFEMQTSRYPPSNSSTVKCSAYSSWSAPVGCQPLPRSALWKSATAALDAVPALGAPSAPPAAFSFRVDESK